MNTPSTQHSSNSNNAGLQQADSEKDRIDRLVQEAIEQQLGSFLMYQVQCVTVEQAAEKLSIADCTVRDWIKNGKLPAVKVGKNYMIRLVDLNAMLKQHLSVVGFTIVKRRPNPIYNRFKIK